MDLYGQLCYGLKMLTVVLNCYVLANVIIGQVKMCVL